MIAGSTEGNGPTGRDTVRRRLGRVLLTVAVVASVTVVSGSGAGAQKVFNPGPFSLEPLAGSIRIRSVEVPLGPRPLPECSDGVDNEGDTLADLADPQCTDPADDSELAPGFQPKVEPSITGTIDGMGNVVVMPAGVVIPPSYIPITDPVTGLLHPVRARVEAVSPVIGKLDPMSGSVSLRLRFRIALDGDPLGVSLGGFCAIGTTQSPIDVDVLSTVGGSPYSPTSGRATVVNSTFPVPATSGCPFLVAPVIDQAVGLPSPSGSNSVTVVGRTTPVLQRGVVARITTAPTVLSGRVPFVVRFDAFASTVALPPATYRWTFPGGTTVRGPKVWWSFSQPGVHQVTLSVTDLNGDVSTSIRNVVVTAPPT
jgi:hypothetical protein